MKGIYAPADACHLGASMLTPVVPLVAALPAFTAGAIGTMILAVMTRVSLCHIGRAITADGITSLICGMAGVAAVTLVAAAFPNAFTSPLLTISVLLWVASFLLFALRYGAMLLRPRIA